MARFTKFISVFIMKTFGCTRELFSVDYKSFKSRTHSVYSDVKTETVIHILLIRG